MEYIIRKLSKIDIPACVEIFKLNMALENWENYPDENLIRELNAAFETNIFCIPTYYVAEWRNDIVGFAGYGRLGIDDGLWGLFWINVHPNHYNKGIGEKLTTIRIDDIKKNDGEIILATTKKIWHLERFGFKKVIPRGDDYYMMMLDLNIL